MKVGKYTYGAENIDVKTWGLTNVDLTIGSFCSIAGNIEVYLGGNHRTDWFTTFPFGVIQKDKFPKFKGNTHTTKGNVIIGNDVWIGNHVKIMSGVTIGDGAILACNSQVVKNVPPYSIVAGNPATVKRMRFEQKVIDKLLELKWWDWTESEINEISDILSSNSIEKLMNIKPKIKEN